MLIHKQVKLPVKAIYSCRKKLVFIKMGLIRSGVLYDFMISPAYKIPVFSFLYDFVFACFERLLFIEISVSG